MKRLQDVAPKSGDTIRLEVTVRNPDKTPKDLTGCSAVWVLAATLSGPALVTKTTGAGIALTNPAAGLLTVTIDPADTAGLKGDYVHELEITDAAGDKATVLDGRFRILEDLVA